MIGNDIVDLAQARLDSNWRRKGFLDKLFTADEQQLIWSATNPEGMVWTLWSMKESAYKVVVRETGYRFFAPTKLVCHLHTAHADRAEGSVFYRNEYCTTSTITASYINSVACSVEPIQPFEEVIIPFAFSDYQHQHQVIRERIKQQYAARFLISESRIQIIKNRVGVPILVINDPFGDTISKPISLSHHGHYGAFVLV